jgi:hypothetical protein
MSWQFLKARDVRSIVVRDLTEEWYLYSIAHLTQSQQDIAPNLRRYFPVFIAENAGSEPAQKLFGEILSCGQVHFSTRVLVEDLQPMGFPALRYEIGWTPEQ